MGKMRFDFSGRVVVVTGAANGIGAACARLFAESGATLALWDIDAGAVEALAAELGGGARALRCDVAKRAEVDAATAATLAAFGRIDVLVNNAGGMVGRSRIEAYTDAYLHQVLALNVTQVAMFMQAVVPSMRARKSGNIINVGSVAARLGGGAGAVVYAGAKGFVSTATRGWAKELVGDGIRVNAVSPGVIETPFHERYSTAEQLKAMQAMIPMNRLGSADECSGAFLYLASDALSGYVTGQIIEVNGGQFMP